jgi:hypothetical protein
VPGVFLFEPAGNVHFMMRGIIVSLLIAGGVFLTGGIEDFRKPAYPWRRLDIGWQLGVGVGALLAALFILLGWIPMTV